MPRASSASCRRPKSSNAQRMHELRLALLAGALAHLLEAVVDQVELEVILVDAGRVEAEHAHLLELEARRCRWWPRLPPFLVKMLRTPADGAGRVVGRGLDQQRDAVRRVALVEISW